ncbi:MAG TPA: hypothetical protein DEQ51_03675 [Alphaproteobacteria bacterium]|nr:hypothetical protein [Alphaproteobacteria bacterium]
MRAMGRYRKDSPSRRPPSKPGQPPADDTALWEQVTKSVTELPSRRNTVFLKEEARTVADPAATAEKAAKKPVAKQTPKAPPAKPPAPRPADLRLGERSGIDRSNARRLQRGQMALEDRLDLHGLSKEQAHRQLIAFISRAVQQNLRHVLVITGKGRDGQGVLRHEVPLWLKDAPLAGYINAISQAQPQDGGAGALYIRLKRQRGDNR